jgi:hypothetical protein
MKKLKRKTKAVAKRKKVVKTKRKKTPVVVRAVKRVLRKITKTSKRGRPKGSHNKVKAAELVEVVLTPAPFVEVVLTPAVVAAAETVVPAPDTPLNADGTKTDTEP